jgi:DNA polymerase III delta prime subunit
MSHINLTEPQIANDLSLDEFIVIVENGIKAKSNFMKSVKFPQLLLRSLRELKTLIGNDELKKSVAGQISNLLFQQERRRLDPSIPEEPAMLNILLYGPPGVGKTLFATKLGKIIYSLGYLEGANEKKQEVNDILKDMMGGSGSNDNLTIYILFLFIMLLISLCSFLMSIYGKFGGIWTVVLFSVIILLILLFSYVFFEEQQPNNKNIDEINRLAERINRTNEEMNINDDELITVVSRADFIDQYVGWTDKKTLKLLKQNIGKVLFVDEAYSLISGANGHDMFGNEALTTLNLFLSQNPRKIVVIFAGYEDLMQKTVFAAQPGLVRRFMWHFNCVGYNAEELYEIFSLQLNKFKWKIENREEVLDLFRKNMDAFPSFGGDTERLINYVENFYSSDFFSGRTMAPNMIKSKHVEKGLKKLRQNNIKSKSSNDDNLMDLISKDPGSLSRVLSQLRTA